MAGQPSPARRGASTTAAAIHNAHDVTTAFRTDPFRHRPASRARRIDGSNRCTLKAFRDCVARIPRACAVERALPSPRPQAGWPNAARREQREEGREQRAASSIHCIFTVSRDHVEKVMKIRNGHPKIFTAYLRCPVTTSKSAQKYLSSLCQKSEKQKLLRRGSPIRFTSYLRCLVTTSMRAEKSPKKIF